MNNEKPKKIDLTLCVLSCTCKTCSRVQGTAVTSFSRSLTRVSHDTCSHLCWIRTAQKKCSKHIIFCLKELKITLTPQLAFLLMMSIFKLNLQMPEARTWSFYLYKFSVRERSQRPILNLHVKQFGNSSWWMLNQSQTIKQGIQSKQANNLDKHPS